VRGSPYLEFDLSEGQAGPLTAPEFSVEGQAKLANRIVFLRAETVFAEGWSEARRGTEFINCTLPGKPLDLEITRRDGEGNDNAIQKGTLFLTPNRLLNQILFQLPTASVRFRRYFHHKKKMHNVPTTGQLVAEFNQSIDRSQLTQLVEELDDLLLLTSLATRHRCVCRGWSLRTECSEIRFYRSRLAAPKVRKIGIQETLVDDPQFKNFLKHAFPAFRQNAGREALRQAIDLLVTSHEGTVEASFLKCFAAVETLVAHFRESHGLTAILDPQQWASFEKDLTSFIKKHPLFKDEENTGRRKLIYEKRSELNRIAFGTAYRQTAASLSKHGFHDDDLWPIAGSSRGLSLAEIRNRIVHGVVFTPPQQEALFKSLIHLRWCAERMIVAFLEWPLERSLVGAFLRHMDSYHTWKEAQQMLERSTD